MSHYHSLRVNLTNILILLSLLVFSSVGLAANLPNGGVVSGEISIAGEVDEYTFDANAGHTVYLRVADTETTQSINSWFSPFGTS